LNGVHDFPNDACVLPNQICGFPNDTRNAANAVCGVYSIVRELAADKSDSCQLIAFDIASSYIDTIKGAAADYTYKVAYRGVRDTDIGAFCPEQKVAAGG